MKQILSYYYIYIYIYIYYIYINIYIDTLYIYNMQMMNVAEKYDNYCITAGKSIKVLVITITRFCQFYISLMLKQH